MSDKVSNNPGNSPAACDSAEACDNQEPSHGQEPCDSATSIYGKAIDHLDKCQEVIKAEINTLSNGREELTDYMVRLFSLAWSLEDEDPYTTLLVGMMIANIWTYRARLDADLVNIKARHAEMDSRIALLKADVLPAAPVDPSLGSPGVD